MERELEVLQDQIEKDKKASSKFIDTQTELQDELKKAKKSYAKANKQVMAFENQIKEKEREKLDLKPEILQIDESIKHTEMKMSVAEENISDSKIATDKQIKALKGLERDLAAVQLRITSHESNI
jgi:predicted  nucleic acid-binding Zn-ribbon protein